MSDIDEKLDNIDASIARVAAAINALKDELLAHWEHEERIRRGFPT